MCSVKIIRRLECSAHAERNLYRAGVGAVVDTLVERYFRVEAFVLGDDKGILYGREETQAETVGQKFIPGIAEGDVVAAYE